MPSGPSAFNPYWTGMQPGAMAYMGYGIRPFDMPFGGIAPQDPFGAQGYMVTSIPPQRYVACTTRSSCFLNSFEPYKCSFFI
jgi:E3 ubiquitin-protein ligase RBBP6